ncbi:hypothetical protein V5O48_002675 [Marasmius crinis-equi]|uniref:FAD-binding domain-containing protein n=1 Tax=Marasmius crinis-equi TaxID=585013 RepID=A0ABR3FV29_9AGAR
MNSRNLPLKFIVIGASIAGLTSAYLLRQSGHDVEVVEKRHRGEKVNDGHIRVPPNMTRLLQTIPGTEELLKKASWVSGVSFVSGETMKLLGEMVFIEEVMSDLGSEFYYIEHADLIAHLYNLCRDARVRFHHGFNVKEVLVDFNDPPTVVSDTGTRLTGDIVVGADGKRGLTRQIVAVDETDSEDEFEDDSRSNSTHEPRDVVMLAFHFLPSESIQRVTTSFSAVMTIPVSELEKDPELAPLVKDDRFVIWAGNGSCLSGGRAGSLFGVVYHDARGPITPEEPDTEWDESVSTSTLESRIKQYHPRLQKLVRIASACRRTATHLIPLTRFTDHTNSLVVIGDAAHVVISSCTHNGSIATEDAFTLGRLFSRVTSRDQVPLLLSGYNQIRRKRSEALEDAEFRGTDIVAVPPGPHRDARDAFFAQTLHMDAADDETLYSIWSSYLEAFSYDAIDAVDEWWLTWGKPIQDAGVVTNGIH